MAPLHYTVPLDHPSFAGHFPGHPVLPGVVLLDWVVLAAKQQLTVNVTGISVVKFHRPLVPGDVVDLVLTPDASGVKFVVMHAEGKVADGKLKTAPLSVPVV